MAAPAKQAAKKLVPDWMVAMKRWHFYASYFPQLGLKTDDCLRSTPEVDEALRRLPRELYNERNYRIKRAFQLSIRKEILPKAEWTPYEDTTNRYLEPYIHDVMKDFAEKAEWSKK